MNQSKSAKWAYNCQICLFLVSTKFITLIDFALQGMQGPVGTKGDIGFPGERGTAGWTTSIFPLYFPIFMNA